MRHTLLSLVLCQLVLMFSAASQAEDYELGQGWQAGDYHLSGYASIEAVDRFDAPAKLEIDDLSLFASGRINQWFNPFTEIELAKYTLVQQGGGAVHGDIVVERFYNDTLLSERNTLRIGKMLTPLGDWNLVHAAPLHPVITRPYSTALGFDAYTSGLSWLHDPENEGIPNFQLYGELGNELFERSETQTLRNFSNVIGGHLGMSFGLMDKVGASFQHGLLIQTGETFTLYGVNANKSFGKLRLESEAITAHFSGAVLPGAPLRVHDHEAGLFALADYAIAPQWHGILEGEYYQDHTVIMPSRSTLIALAYRPDSTMVWKLEYIYQAGESASFSPIYTGWKAAFASFF